MKHTDNTRQTIQSHKGQSHAFTLVEMLVIAPILVLMIGGFVGLIIALSGETLRTRGADAMIYGMNDALFQIQSDVELSTGFLAENDVVISSTGQGYGDTVSTGSTTNFNNQASGHNALILRLTATTENRNSSNTTARPVTLINTPNDCSDPSLYVSNIPMTINVIYFVKDNTLWRRVIMPSDYDSTTAYCGSPWQRPSCTPNYDAVARPFCKASDAALVTANTNLSMTINYYPSPGSTTADTVSNGTGTASTRAAALLNMESIQLAITANQNIGGQAVSRSNSLRINRL